jgi:hypothetical protein
MKTIAFVCTFSAMLLASSMASAGPLTLADVGSVDDLIAQTTLQNSGDDTELTWIAGVLNVDKNTLSYSKITNSSGDNWQLISGTTNIFALDLGSEPSWFMLKTGAGSAYRNFLYQNLGELQYAVIDFTELGFSSINIGKISHVASAGDATSVPEPASLAGIGLGLATIAAKLRRRKQ